MNRLALILMLATAAVQGEPSPTVHRLMDEPASMFDIGMLRLRQENSELWVPRLKARSAELSLLRKGEVFASESVVYNLKENRISIDVVLSGVPDEALCAKLLREYKDVISPLRIRSPDFAAVLFAGSFDHVNYSISGAPAKWHREIVDIVRVTVGIEEKLTPPEPGASAEYKALRELAGGRVLFCSGPLTSDEVSYTKHGF